MIEGVHTPRAITYLLAHILFKKAQWEALKEWEQASVDPGGKVLALYDRCIYCEGSKDWFCSYCHGEGFVPIN